MTTTYANLVDEVLFNLSGYTLRQDRTTHIIEDIDDSTLSIKFDNAAQISKGTVEIDDELIWLDSYDRIGSTAVVPPYGRGYQGTVKAPHTAGSRAVISPTFPRASIKRAINDTIDAIFPTLFGVGVHTFTFNNIKIAYELPAEAQTVLYVSYDRIGSTKEWGPVKEWRQDPLANVGAFGSGNTISIYQNIPSGRTVQVFYSKKPSTLTSLDDEFEATTGLPSSCKDVVVYGAASRLISFIDPGRLNYSSAEADQADTKLQYGSGASTARFIQNLYLTRLNEESKKLRDLYPIRVHYTRY